MASPTFVGAGAFAHNTTASISVSPHALTAVGDAMLAIAAAADTGAITFPGLIPDFKAVGAKSVGTTAAVTVSAPSGVAVGDLEILISSTISGNTVSITTAGGSAWTSLGSATTTSGEDIFVWWRVRQTGDTNPAVTPSGDHSCSARLCFAAGTFDPTTPISHWTTGNETTSDTSFSWAPGYSTTVDNSLVCCIASSGVDSNTAQVPVMSDASLANLASLVNYETINGAGGGFGCTAGEKATAGTIGTFACTYTSASSKAYASFSINPNPDATPWVILADDTNGTQRTVVAGKIAGSSEGAFSVGFAGGANAHVCQCFTWSGNDTTDASSAFPTLSAVSHATGSGGGGTGTANGITPSKTDSAIVFALTLRGGGTDGGGASLFSGWSGTDPTFTEISDNDGVLGANECALGVAWGTTTDGAATGSRTVTLSSLSTGTWISTGFLIEIAAPSSSGPQTVSPTGLGSATGFGAPTPAPGGISVSMTALGSAQAFGAPKTNIKFAISGLGSAQVFGSVTPHPGGVAVQPSGKGSAQAFDTPKENIAFTIGGLSSAGALGAPTVGVGGTGQSVPVAGLVSAGSFGSPTPSPGGVVATVSGLGSAGAFGSPQENQTEHILGLSSAGAFGSVTPSPGGVVVPISGLSSAGQIGTPGLSGGLAPTFNPAVQGGKHRR